MNGIQSRKAQNIDKAFPGCLGRMVNLFDLSNGVAGNRLLRDKPHCDVVNSTSTYLASCYEDGNGCLAGSSLARSQSDVARMLGVSFGDQIEDKMIVSPSRRISSNEKAIGTPMKALIAEEMSKDVGCKHNPPNVVAKLMGLDTLPQQQPYSVSQRSPSKSYSRHSLSHSGIIVDCWEEDHGFLDKQIQFEGCRCQEQSECKDVYEIWQHSRKMNSRDSSPQKGMYIENVNEKKMAIVRKKFMEAKRLSTDEKGRQSREFQDALEVLSSNRDLFLKFLQEPNSLFSQHLCDMQSMTSPPETKRITVLRPSKVVDNEKFIGSVKRTDQHIKKPTKIAQAMGWDKNNPRYSPNFSNQRVDEFPAQPTRIVVLKPSPGKTHDIKAVASPPPSSPRVLNDEDYCDEPEEDEAQESREVAKEIGRNMCENMMGHRRDETLLSSVFSNGYIGDESLFIKSENEYAVGNLSDSEIMSPTSRHSWDCINRFGSPFSSSSFSRASCSPESSVCREAKKRLSERWAMMTSNGSSQDTKNARRSSSTLGEMLALSCAKKSSDEAATKKEQESSGSTSCLASNLYKEESTADSPKSLLRSKSVPVSSTGYGSRLNGVILDTEADKTEVPKDLIRTKSTKSSFKGKVSSLFFSRNKKSNKEKSGTAVSKDESELSTPETPGSPIILPGKIGDNASQCINSTELEEHLSPDRLVMGAREGDVSLEGGLLVAKPIPLNVGENQDQPSPISVLDPPFEEDDSTISKPSGNVRPDRQGKEVPLSSNLIDKSPPIGSVARTLSWEDSFAETATPSALKSSSISSGPEEEEQDWILLVQTLLSAARQDGKALSDTFSARWHSPESALDPSLRDHYANLNDKELLHEVKRRQRRSNRKLVFDCINAALMEHTGYGSDRRTRAVSCSRAHSSLREGVLPMLVDHVWDEMKDLWDEMKDWFCGEGRYSLGDGGDSDSLVVERVVRNEVLGKGWDDKMGVELDNFGQEIEGKLLEELVEEAVLDLNVGV